MEVYALDSLLRRVEVIDRFDSFIWTERWNASGDFELRLPSTRANRQAFEKGMLLATNESLRVMRVDSIEDATNDDGTKQLIITGPSLEEILKDRMAWGVLDDLTTVPKWVITDTPGNIARKIFDDICRNGTLDVKDIIPYLQPGTIMPSDSVPEPEDPITVELEPQSVYDAVKGICDLYDLGFRLLRNGDTSQLYFDVFSGNDRTTQQAALSPVVFAPQLDNVQNTKELSSESGYKNVAIVLSPVGYETVYSILADSSADGFERRVLVVRADDITDPDPLTATALMVQRGIEELSKHRRFMVFDGEITQSGTYKYGVDYYLGDLVEMQNQDGAINYLRVTEQIFVSDEQGERSYPTLAVYETITPGSWRAWDPSEVWLDYDADTTTTWATV